MANLKPGDTSYFVPEQPEYDAVVRKLKNVDYASAETVFNPLVEQLIENIHAVKLSDDTKAKEDLSNVSKEDFSQKVLQTGVVGENGSAAAKDLTNVTNNDFKNKVIESGILEKGGIAAPKAIVKTVVLKANQWVGNSAPFVQRVVVEGVTKNSLLTVFCDISEKMMTEAGECKVLATTQAEEIVTFTAYEQKPLIDLNYTIVNGGEL